MAYKRILFGTDGSPSAQSAGSVAAALAKAGSAQLIVACAFDKPTDAERIVARVERALQRVDAARITLNPDCGFAPGSAANVDIDEVYRKLCAESRAARLLRERRA